jgi:hypothetical protein
MEIDVLIRSASLGNNLYVLNKYVKASAIQSGVSFYTVSESVSDLMFSWSYKHHGFTWNEQFSKQSLTLDRTKGDRWLPNGIPNFPSHFTILEIKYSTDSVQLHWHKS